MFDRVMNMHGGKVRFRVLMARITQLPWREMDHPLPVRGVRIMTGHAAALFNGVMHHVRDPGPDLLVAGIA